MPDKDQVAEALDSLLQQGFTVILHGFDDQGEQRVMGSAGRDRDRRFCDGASLTEVVQRLNRTEEIRKCSSCGLPRPVSQLGTDQSASDGKSSKCRLCMRLHAAQRRREKAGKPTSLSPSLPASRPPS